MLLRRYISLQLLFSTLVLAIGMTLIIWLTQSLKLLDLVINGGAPLDVFGYMLVLTMPRFFELILPIALAISIVFLFNKMTADSELVVMQACGFSPWQIARSTVLLSIFIGGAIFLLTGWLTPQANQELDRLKTVAKSGFSVNLLRPGVFNTLSDNVLIYLSERNSMGDLRGLLIHITTPDQPASTIWAKSGGIIMQDNRPIVMMRDGMRQQYNPQTHRVESLHFESYHVDLSKIFNKEDLIRSTEPNEYVLPALFGQSEKQIDPRHQRQFRAEVNVRLSRPLLAFSFALCMVTPFVLGRYNRRGQGWRVFQVVMLLVALQAGYLGSVSLAQRYIWGNALLYACTLIPAMISMLCLFNAHPSGIWRSWLRSHVTKSAVA